MAQLGILFDQPSVRKARETKLTIARNEDRDDETVNGNDCSLSTGVNLQNQ